MSGRYLIATAITLATLTAAHAGDYRTMETETGCSSKASEEKKAAVYKAKYEGQSMTVIGKLFKAASGEVFIKMLPGTLSYDISVNLADSKATYDLEKDSTVKVSFIVNRHGGCFLPYGGKDGIIQAIGS